MGACFFCVEGMNLWNVKNVKRKIVQYIFYYSTIQSQTGITYVKNDNRGILHFTKFTFLLFAAKNHEKRSVGKIVENENVVFGKIVLLLRPKQWNINNYKQIIS